MPEPSPEVSHQAGRREPDPKGPPSVPPAPQDPDPIPAAVFESIEGVGSEALGVETKAQQEKREKEEKALLVVLVMTALLVVAACYLWRWVRQNSAVDPFAAFKQSRPEYQTGFGGKNAFTPTRTALPSLRGPLDPIVQPLTPTRPNSPIHPSVSRPGPSQPANVPARPSYTPPPSHEAK